jgi:hypothetical protein
MATCPARTRERTVRVGREAQCRDTRVAKRQGRRLLSAPPQVRILPLVQRPKGPHRLAGQGRRPLKAETRVRIPVGTPGPCRPTARSPLFQGGDGGAAPPTGTRPRPVEDSSSSKRDRAGSNPAGRSPAPEVRVDGRRATNAEIGGSNPPGGATRTRERSSTGERRPDMPETGVRLPSLVPRSAPGSIWRGYPAVYRARRVRFPSGARPWRGSLVRAAAL